MYLRTLRTGRADLDKCKVGAIWNERELLTKCNSG